MQINSPSWNIYIPDTKNCFLNTYAEQSNTNILVLFHKALS